MKSVPKGTLAILAVVFVACNTGPREQSDANERNIQQNIDPRIVGEERRKIADIMRLIPSDQRDNVIYMSESGQILVNRPELREEFKLARKLEGNIYESASGQRFVETPSITDGDISSQVYTCSPVTSGAFRRVATKRGTNITAGRFSYALAEVWVPGADSQVRAKQTTTTPITQLETPYVFIGGHSTTSAGVPITEVDAGLQWSQQNRDWAIYLKAGNNLATGARISSPASVTLELYVPIDGTVIVRVTGGSLSSGTNAGRTLPLAAPGWTKSGVGNVMKRVTSIAQASTDPTSGSYLLNVAWIDSKLARFSGTGPIPIGQTVPVAELRQWGTYGNDIDPGNINDGLGIGCVQPVGRVTSDGFTTYNEEVSIDLR